MVVFLLLQSLEVMVCCGIRYILYSLSGYRIKCTLNGIAIYKFLSNSGHRCKDTSMPHTGVSAPVHNYYHLVTANLHNKEAGNAKLWWSNFLSKMVGRRIYDIVLSRVRALCSVKFLNQPTDFHEISYGHYDSGRHPEAVIFSIVHGGKGTTDNCCRSLK
jgi:hypothetical protein